MRFHVGTSGYSYKEWKGVFYPERTSPKAMLGFYAGQFTTVEINSTFQGVPKESTFESWVAQTPETFRFALKAPQAITHWKRLKNAEADVDLFLTAAATLKDRLGPILFQLPPNFKKDQPRLEGFLDAVSSKATCAFEFRHASWFDEEVTSLLKSHGCALCAAEAEDEALTHLVPTAKWTYLRLRQASYSDDQLRAWIDKIRRFDFQDVYLYFKHEDSGTAPKFAARFLELSRS